MSIFGIDLEKASKWEWIKSMFGPVVLEIAWNILLLWKPFAKVVQYADCTVTVNLLKNIN